MTWFKFLADGATGPFSGYRWPAPHGPGEPGAWVSAADSLEPCRSGLHLCRARDLPFWLLEELYTVDVEGPVTEHDSFVLARRARLARRLEGWTRQAAHQFSCDCAWRVRDLLADELRGAGRLSSADGLVGCTTMGDLQRMSREIEEATGAGRSRLAGYALDAAVYAANAEADSGWAAAAATTGFIAATAARVAGGDEGPAASANERSLQARWLAGLSTSAQ